MGNKRKDLTEKQKNFALYLFQGLSQSEAYIKAGYSSNQTSITIGKNAYELANNPLIIGKVEELRGGVEVATTMDYQERQARLSEIARENILNHKGVLLRTSNIQAIAELNRMEGIGNVNLQVNLTGKELKELVLQRQREALDGLDTEIIETPNVKYLT